MDQGVFVPSSQIRHPSFITRLRNLERMREISEVAVRHGFGYFFERHRLYALLRFADAGVCLPRPSGAGTSGRCWTSWGLLL